MNAATYKRRCTGTCGRVLPMTRDYFYTTNQPPYFRAECIPCTLEARKGRDRYAPEAEVSRLRAAARKRAHARLRTMYPDLWHKLLSEEYDAEGLDAPRKVLAGRKDAR